MWIRKRKNWEVNVRSNTVEEKNRIFFRGHWREKEQKLRLIGVNIVMYMKTLKVNSS